ncbi:MAG: hypothetical protein VZS44_02075 [Bacilli bacterium]|nr:hypothetical protein [Bacilli bacterium]
MKKNKYDYDKKKKEEIDLDEREDIADNKFKQFLYNYKNDKRYKSKVQLTGYLVFIILLVIFLNVSNTGNNYNYSSKTNSATNTTNTSVDSKEENDDSALFKKINSNYTYNINISLTKIKDDNNNKENIIAKYNGSSDNDNIIINKITNNNTSTFYKGGEEYYKKNNEEYELVADNDVYDIVSAKYIEFSNIKKYIDKANLDHYTNYSSGKKEYFYNLNINEIIKSYKKEDKITINIVEENDIVVIDIDYTNLFNIINNKIIECKIKYEYSKIEETEKIEIFENENNKTT